VFFNCSKLTNINVQNGNSKYVDIDGVLFNVSKTELLQYPIGKGNQSYTIPSSVTNIGIYAFFNCSNLKNINVQSGNVEYADVDGVLFNASKTKLIQYPVGKINQNYTIPSSVISIGDSAFSNCQNLTRITIPSSVTSIENYAFDSCPNLTGIMIPVSVTSIGGWAFYNCFSLTNITIPANSSLISIGQSAFWHCSSLTSITFSSSVISIGDRAFRYCLSLEKAVFLGDAPQSFGSSVFDRTASGFSVRYLNGALGFTSPTWKGYPSAAVELTPSSSWLVKNGLADDLDISSDINGDGVSLLMAYALNLDPYKNLQSAMPVAKVDGESLSMEFYGANQDVNYLVEVSEDMKTWVSDGVSLSDPDENGNRIATVSRENDGEEVSSLFLRLVVEQK